MNTERASWQMAALLACGMLTACGGGGGGGGTVTPPAKYTIGGSTSGLSSGGSVSLANNGGDTLTVSANGNFTFATSVAQGGSYAVTVTTQPRGQTCTVANGSGSNVMANVSTVAIACTNNPQFAYVVNNGANSISQYAIAADGTLSPLSPASVATGASPQSITVDPTRHYVYVTNATDDTVSQYVIQTNGTLTPNTPATVTTGHKPDALAFDPAGKSAYVANVTDQTVSQFTVGTGGVLSIAASAPVATGVSPWIVTITPNGKFAFVSNHGTGIAAGTTVSQFSIQSSDGALVAQSPATITTGAYPSGIAVDVTGAYAYVALVGTDSVAQYGVGTNGQLTSLSPATVAAGSQAVYVAVHPNNKYAYVVNYTPASDAHGTVSQYSIGTNGTLTPLAAPTAPTGIGPDWMAFDATAQHAYVVNFGDSTVCEYSIGADGSLTVIGTVTAGASPFAIATTY